MAWLVASLVIRPGLNKPWQMLRPGYALVSPRIWDKPWRKWYFPFAGARMGLGRVLPCSGRGSSQGYGRGDSGAGCARARHGFGPGFSPGVWPGAKGGYPVGDGMALATRACALAWAWGCGHGRGQARPPARPAVGVDPSPRTSVGVGGKIPPIGSLRFFPPPSICKSQITLTVTHIAAANARRQRQPHPN
jgi:hypothetical protein